jgi:hypothetical protein
MLQSDAVVHTVTPPIHPLLEVLVLVEELVLLVEELLIEELLLLVEEALADELPLVEDVTLLLELAVAPPTPFALPSKSKLPRIEVHEAPAPTAKRSATLMGRVIGVSRGAKASRTIACLRSCYKR